MTSVQTVYSVTLNEAAVTVLCQFNYSVRSRENIKLEINLLSQ